jgi:hypothetical protein
MEWLLPVNKLCMKVNIKFKELAAWKDSEEMAEAAIRTQLVMK